ncbi:splicing factor U2af large subunit B isoform X3, partial [Tanacetum coccineum]
ATLGPSQPNPNLNLGVVHGLPYYSTAAQVRELLDSFVDLRGFDLVKDRETGNSKGYAFCVYQDLSVMDIACAATNGIKMGDRTLTVRRANQGQTQPKWRVTVTSTITNIDSICIDSICEKSVATYFSHVMSAIGGNTAGPGDAVVNVYINHEKKFAFVEMRYVEEASNAMALDGIIFEGARVKVRRPSDYNPSLAATLGPSQPNPNLNLGVVRGLPYYSTEAQVRELLESFVDLRGFDLVKDRETGNSKGSQRTENCIHEACFSICSKSNLCGLLHECIIMDAFPMEAETLGGHLSVLFYFSISVEWDFIRVTILAFFGSLEVFLEIADCHRVAINCWVFIGRVFLDNYGFRLDGNLGWRNSWLNEELTHQERAVLHVLVTYFLLRFCNFALSVYAEQRCLLAQCILNVYVEIAKSPMCIIVLLTHVFLACNLIYCMAFGTSELNGFTKGVWNKFNTMSRLENLSNNWTDAISGVSIRLANSDNGGYLYFYMDCLGNGVPWVISCTIVLLS